MGSYEIKNPSNVDDKKIVYFLAAALLPILLIYILYLFNNDSALLHAISDSAANLPAITSSKNPLLSKVMDVYCKTAPLLAIVIFYPLRNLPIISDETPLAKKIKSFLICNLFTIVMFYFLAFKNIDLVSSAKLLRVASTNDFTLVAFYISLYVIFYIFTFFYVFIFVNLCKSVKER